ncbi:LysR family transcriptional regulator [Streptococcus sp. H31]|uniref:LysR family transcriptional regulator n=1 Tax=Streptococcus huangxiaojuni TaxID=3237239 RepID=UPI0034A2099A
MQIQDLKIFKTIYDTGSINKTAQIHNFAQSNITARLKVLENEFSTLLFNRSSKGVTPTKNGKVFYDYACSVIAKTDKLIEQLAQGSVTKYVWAPEMLFQYLVVEKQLFSLTDYHFEIKKMHEILALKHSEQDIIMSYYPLSLPNYQLSSGGSFDITYEYSLDCRRSEDLPVLINSDEMCPFRRKTLEVVAPSTKIIEIDSFSTIIGLVENNQGCALLPVFAEKAHRLHSDGAGERFPIDFFIYQRI